MNQDQIEDLLPTRRTLLSRLKDWNDQENWRVFFDTYWRLIYSTAIKGGLTDAEAQDAVQETVISVMKSLRTFQYAPQKGSFKSWLLQLTRWRILDQLKKRNTRLSGRKGQADTSTRTATIERLADPSGPALEAVWDQEWEANLLEAALARVKQKVDPKQYQIFDLHVFKKWPVAKVARSLRITAARVYVTKHRIAKLVKKEVAHLRDKPI
jgi:RNA polymerase sigma factor (sigma-70 family)